MIVALFAGFIAAFLGSIPVAGPISVLVLERGIEGDRRGAIAISVGSALGEMFYAGLAFAGVSTLLSMSPMILPIVHGIGAGVLFVIGAYFVFRRKASRKEKKAADAKRRPSRKWLLGLSITALNPTLFVSWTVVATALHGAGVACDTPASAILFALGVGTGIVAWFLVLLAGVKRFRKLVGPTTLDRGMRVVGCLLMVAGLVLGVKAVAF